MSNLYRETIKYLEHIGYTVMDVDYCSIIGGHNKEVQFSFAKFEENSDFEYDEFSKDIEVNISLRIVFKDGTWLERWEEDGFEAWRHVIPPKKDSNKENKMNKNDIKCLPMQMRINIWLQLGERGISSNTICYVLSGLHDLQIEGFEDELRWLGSPPKDPSDFRRCYELLEIIPEWKSRLKEISYVFPAWKAYADNWEAMEELYQEERNNKNGLAPKLYEFMKSL